MRPLRLMTFKDTAEYKQSKSMNPHCNDIYYKVFNATKVTRTQDTPLDMEFAIDVIVKLPNGSQLIDMPRLMLWINSVYNLEQLELKSIPSSGLASFIAIPYPDIPKDCYIATSEDYE